MVKTYKRNSFGRMTWVWYERPWFWQIIALGFSTMLNIMVPKPRLKF